MRPGFTRVSSRCRLRGLEGRLIAEGLHDHRRQAGNEAGVAAELHLETQALALVQRGRARVGHRLAEQFARQVLLVAAVPGLVHRAHQRAEELVVAEARGHAHVLRHAATERVGADVEPTALEVESEHAHHLATQLALCLHRERPDRLDHRLARLHLLHLANQPRQPLPHFSEDAVDGGAGGARLVHVHQRVVGAQAGEVGEQPRFFAADGEHLAEVLDEARPVVGGPLLSPGVLATRLGHRAAPHQGLGHGIRAAPVAPDLSQVGALQVVQRLLLGPLQVVGQRLVGAQAVQQRRHLGHRRGAGLVALGRHVCGLVPAGDGLQVAQPMQALVGLGQGVVGGGGGHGCAVSSQRPIVSKLKA
jgi:hypothetical protein